MNRRSSINTQRSQQGFTLLELLTVMFIIGIIVSFAGLSIGQNTSRVVQDEAERLHGLIRLASEEAVLQGRELALQFNDEGYVFLMPKGAGWEPIEDDAMLRQRPLPEAVHLELLLEGVAMALDNKENPPRFLIMSSGEFDPPFELNLRSDEGDYYRIAGSVDGKLALQRGEGDEI